MTWWEILHLISTAFMVGVIWYVQLVHYPMFDEYEKEKFSKVHNRHQILTTFVVGPMMLLEVVSACFIFDSALFLAQPLWLVSALLLLGVWMSTAFLQMPCHFKLEKQFSSRALKFLVRSNWLRTLAWTARLICLTLILQKGQV